MGGEEPGEDRNTRNVNPHEYNINTKGEVVRSPLFIFLSSLPPSLYSVFIMITKGLF